MLFRSAQLAERARWGGVKGAVLGPSRFAGPGAETYTIELRIDAVRAFFDRWFAPAGQGDGPPR